MEKFDEFMRAGDLGRAAVDRDLLVLDRQRMRMEKEREKDKVECRTEREEYSKIELERFKLLMMTLSSKKC